MKNLTGPIIRLHFMRHNSVVLDTTHGLIHFPHLTMQVKSELSETSAKPQAVLNSITIPQVTTKTITAFVHHVSEWNPTGTVTPVEKFTETAYNIPFNVNNNWEEDSSQSHQHNGITLYNQLEHTNCRILRSHSGAIQMYQTSGHGNS